MYGMALLTPNFSLVVVDRVPLLSRGWWGAGGGQKTDPCPCHSDLILGPFPGPSHICRSGMASMDQRKWLVGFEPVTSLDRTLASISPLSPSRSDFTLLSGSGILEGIQLSLLINQMCLHCSDVNDRHLNMLTLTF